MATVHRKPQRKSTTRRAGARYVWRPAFISALSKTGNVTVSAEAAGINRTTAYASFNSDPEFAEQWNEAVQEAADRIEAEALRRATRGVNKPVWYKGQQVGTELEYSDTLMLAMLKGHKPDKYGDKLVIRLAPEQIAILQKFGLTPSEAFEQLIQRLSKVENE